MQIRKSVKEQKIVSNDFPIMTKNNVTIMTLHYEQNRMADRKGERQRVMPQFLDYDILCSRKEDFDFTLLNRFDAVIFNSFDEYTFAIAELALKYCPEIGLFANVSDDLWKCFFEKMK